MKFDKALNTSDFLNILVYDLTTGDKDIIVRVSDAIQKTKDNDFPNNDKYGIPKAFEKPVKDLLLLQDYFTTTPTKDNAAMVAEEILELFTGIDAYINSFG